MQLLQATIDLRASFHVSGAVAFSKDLVFDATMDVWRTKDDDNNCIELGIEGSKTLLDLAKSVGARDLNTCRSAIQAKLLNIPLSRLTIHLCPWKNKTVILKAEVRNRCEIKHCLLRYICGTL